MELLMNWQSLSALGKIFWIVAIASSAIFLIMIIISLLFGDSDVHLDAHFDGNVEVGEGFGGFLLSLKSIMMFLVMFGWAGVISMGLTHSLFLNILMSAFFGILGMVVAALILYSATKLTYNGTLDLNNAIGKTGEVILSIPPKKEGKGQVQVVIQNSLRTLEAVSEEAEIIKSGTQIQVIDVAEDNVLVVITK